MTSRQKSLLYLAIFFVIVSLSGCATLGAIGAVPGALIWGLFKLIGSAFSLAKKLPWWMWI